MSSEPKANLKTVVSTSQKKPLSLSVSGMAVCAALYAIGSYLTAQIHSPLGVGQFRPAVLIPAFFAVVFGPLPAGVGAALGTLISDSISRGQLYAGSYLAAVPGNFIGFYLFGLLTKKFTWGRFVLASHITLTLANFVVAALYVLVFKLLFQRDAFYSLLSPEALVVYIVGMTIWWFVTMLPFVLLITPLLIKAVAQATPTLVPEDVRRHSLKEELPQKLFSLAILVPGIVMFAVGLITMFTPLGDSLPTSTGFRR